jgi:cell division protein FtsB
MWILPVSRGRPRAEIRGPQRTAAEENLMRLKRSSIITKIIVFALIAYAGVSLLSIQARIEAAREEQRQVQRLVDQKKLSNAELEYDIANYDDPEVKADIARENLGFILPGEKIFFDAGEHG